MSAPLAPTRAQLLRNTAVVLSGVVAVRACGALSFAFLAWAFSSSELGALTLALTYSEILRLFVDCGSSRAAIHRISAGANASRVMADAIAGRVACALVVVALFGITYVLGWTGSLSGWTAMAIAIALLVHAVVPVLAVPHEAGIAMAPMSRLYVLNALLTIGTSAYGARHHWSAAPFIGVATVLEVFLGMQIARINARSGWFVRGATRSGAWALLRHGVPLGLISMITLLYFRLDVLMLGAWRGTAAVGEYAIAFRGSEALLMAAGALSTSLFPFFARLASDGSHTAVRQAFRTTYAAATAGAFGAAYLVSLFAPYLLPRVLPQHPDAVPLLATLVWSVVFMFANMQTSDLLVTHGCDGLVLRISVANLALNAALNAVLIPRYGAIGACAATVATEGVNGALQGWFVMQRLRIAVPIVLAFVAPVATAAVALALRQRVVTWPWGVVMALPVLWVIAREVLRLRVRLRATA
jgi:O-antigen/teichoic acid export membrane protein